MGLYKRILVAVDGSDASLNALSESIKLSYWVRGRVCAIYVAPPYEGDLSLTGVKDLKALLSEPCEITLAKIKETVENFGASIEALCVEGEPLEKILEYAETEDFDLIVAGTTKKNALYRALIKGVTEKIMRFSSKDVLIIPENTSIGWDNILIPISSLQDSKFVAIKVNEISKAYGSELLFLSVSGDDIKKNKLTEEIIKDIKELFPGIANKIIMKKEDNVGAITDTALEHNANLIIMSSWKKKGIRNFFSKNTVEKVVNSSSCPVLVISDELMK